MSVPGWMVAPVAGIAVQLATTIVGCGQKPAPVDLTLTDQGRQPTTEIVRYATHHYGSECPPNTLWFDAGISGTQLQRRATHHHGQGQTDHDTIDDSFDDSVPLPLPGTSVQWQVRATAAPRPAYNECRNGESTRTITIKGPPKAGVTGAAFIIRPPTPTVTQTVTTTTPGTTITGTATVTGGTTTVTTTVPGPTTTTTVTTGAPVTNAGLVADFTATPSSPSPGGSVTFNAAPSTADGGATITSYSWQFGTTGAASPSTATGQQVTSTLTQVGTYPVTLTIVDSKGRSTSVTKSVSTGSATPRSTGTARPRQTTIALPAPLGIIPGVRTPRAHTAVGLAVADAVDAVRATRYAWDLDGDGRADRTTRAPGTTVVFGRGGTRVVNLRVFRANSTSQTTRLVLPVRRASRVPLGARRVQRLTIRLSTRALLSRPSARRRAVADHGGFAVQLLTSHTDTQNLLAPLVAGASARFRSVVRSGGRRIDTTYLVTSTLMPGRMCLRATTRVPVSGATFTTLRTLGATGSLRRVALDGRLTVLRPASRAELLLDGAPAVRRGPARSLRAACRALVRGGVR